MLTEIHPFARYPEVPKEFFDRKCKVDIESVPWVIKQLSIAFRDISSGGVHYLPAPIVGICTEYVQYTFESVINEILDECDSFTEDGGILGILKSNPDLGSSTATQVESDSIKRFAVRMEERVSKYSFWFRVRRHIPLCMTVESCVIPAPFPMKRHLQVPCSSTIKQGFFYITDFERHIFILLVRRISRSHHRSI